MDFQDWLYTERVEDISKQNSSRAKINREVKGEKRFKENFI
jgi:hypothetical protein